MHTPSLADTNFATLAALFPNAVIETVDANGAVVRAIDKDVLTQEINAHVVEGREERYQFTWPDKRNSILIANAPIAATLRPCREESVDFDTTENLYIEGDNLDVLKLLRETYLNRVKVIYIDPPYNTSHDFIYNDDFSEDVEAFLSRDGQYDELGNRLVLNTDSNGRFHTDWLNMIYPRIRVARDLLAEDGVIFISIDDNEVENLRKICNEIFGKQNYVAQMVWQSTAGSNTGTNIITVTEYVLVYAKSFSACRFNTLPISDADKYTLEDEYVAKRGKYVLNKLDRRMTGPHYSDALNYAIKMPDGQMIYPGSTDFKNTDNWNYRWSKTKVEWGIANEFIVFKQVDSKWNAYFKQYLKVDNDDNSITRSLPYQNLIKLEQFNTTQGTREIMTLFGRKMFDYAKPSELIKYIVNICPDKNSIVLDFFSGSASTAQAVFQLNSEDNGHRRFILVQLPEKTDDTNYPTIPEIGKERIRRAGAKIKADSPLTTASLDVGFRVLKLDSTNMKDVYYTPEEYAQMNFSFDGLADNIKEDRSPDDLLFQVMLDLGIPLSAKITQDGDVYSVNANYLIACFKRVDIALITEIAKQKPYYAVFRDSSFASDSAMVNFEQVFNTYSPNTIRRVL
ncbi:site-specific DNA-methyltransferase [Lachnospiraceae bacterium ZAX-1]